MRNVEDKNAITTLIPLIDKAFEQTVDADITLPDYCPEIVRVLQCSANPNLVKVQIEGSKIICDGYVRFVVLYTSENPGRLHSFVNIQNFTKTIETGIALSDLTEVTVKSEYVQARATGSRSIIAKSAVSVHVFDQTFDSTIVTLQSQSSDIQLKNKSCEVSIPTGRQVKSFLTEIEINPEFDDTECVLDAEANIFLDEYKVMDGKVMVKGQILLESSLLSSEGSVHKITNRSNFSQFIPFETAVPSMLCKFKCNVLECKEEVEQDIDGSVNKLSFLVTANLYVTCYENRQVDVALDGYSTLYETETEYQKATLMQYKPVSNATSHVSKRIVFDVPIKSVIDQKIELFANAQSVEDDTAGFPCFGKLHLIAEGEDNQIYVWSKAIDFTVDLSELKEYQFFDPAAVIVDHVNIKTEQNSIFLSFDVRLQGMFVISTEITCLKELEPNTEQKKERDESVAMIIYFANQGESVWDIAKRYNTTARQISAANALTGETIKQKQVVLIPLVSG